VRAIFAEVNATSIDIDVSGDWIGLDSTIILCLNTQQGANLVKKTRLGKSLR